MIKKVVLLSASSLCLLVLLMVPLLGSWQPSTSFQKGFAFRVSPVYAQESRILIEGADSIFSQELQRSEQVSHQATNVSPRILVEYADSILSFNLEQPLEIGPAPTPTPTPTPPPEEAPYASPILQAPIPGAVGVSLTPSFSWASITDAVKYEFELSTSPATTAGSYFVDALVGLTGDNALVTLGWQCDITLDYDTSYFWHVKAITAGGGESVWGTAQFTTIAEAAVPPSPTPTPTPSPTPSPHPSVIPQVLAGILIPIAMIILLIYYRRMRHIREEKQQLLEAEKTEIIAMIDEALEEKR